MSTIRIEYCGEWWTVEDDDRFTIGRTGDLAVDDNPYLHRTFLEIRNEAGVWFVANVGRQLTATIGDANTNFVAHIAPGGVLPIVFDRTRLRFGAGPTTYEIQLVLPDPPFSIVDETDAIAETDDPSDLAELTRAPAVLTPIQRVVVLSLAEHALQRHGSGPSPLPTSGEAARRLGWTEKKFNKKLDQVCQKLAKAGVKGLHGGPGDLAANRRARLVEYCLSSRIVTEGDLAELDDPAVTGAEPDDD